VLRRHRGITSIAGGALFALLVILVGAGGRVDPVGVGLAAVMGLVFAAAMYRSAGRGLQR